jgi:hypothetical protein
LAGIATFGGLWWLWQVLPPCRFRPILVGFSHYTAVFLAFLAFPAMPFSPFLPRFPAFSALFLPWQALPFPFSSCSPAFYHTRRLQMLPYMPPFVFSGRNYHPSPIGKFWAGAYITYPLLAEKNGIGYNVVGMGFARCARVGENRCGLENE